MKKSALAPGAGHECARTRTCKLFPRRAGEFLSCFAALLFVAAAAKAQTETLPRNDSERELFDLLNRERTANDLPELKWDDALFKAARKHALLMLDLNTLEHQLPDEPGLEERVTAAGARFSYLAENIAIGRDAQTIHSGWMHSPGHRANILNPRITAVGIAVVNGPAGLFAVQDFSRAFTKMSPEQQENQVGSLLTAKGLHVTGATAEARRSCDGNIGLLGVNSVVVIRFESGDLTTLDPEVAKKIAAEPNRNVAVGACRTRDAAGFSRYKIALLFY